MTDIVNLAALHSHSRWLDCFFAEDGDPAKTDVAIFDSKNGTISTRYFSGMDGEDQTLVSALQTIGADISTRIIAVVHEGYKYVDRQTLRTLVKFYNIDKGFLLNHFFWDYIRCSKDDLPRIKPPALVSPPPFLPSFVDFLSMDNQGQITTIIPARLDGPPLGSVQFIQD